MTYAPAKLLELEAYWKAQGGIPLGIVGDASHVAIGTSYHLGKDRLLPGAYSVQLPRDKAGLTDAASAIDLGKLNGTYKGLQDFSRWAVARLQADPAARFDVREVIYSPDGVVVQRYSGVDNLIHTGPGNGDASHRFHTHWSFYRDSEFRDKIALFSPYFEEAPVAGPEVRDIAAFTGTATIKGDGHSAIVANDGTLVGLAAGTPKDVVGKARLATAWPGHPSGVVYLVGSEPAYLLAEDVDIIETHPDCKDVLDTAAALVMGDAAVTAEKIKELA